MRAFIIIMLLNPKLLEKVAAKDNPSKQVLRIDALEKQHKKQINKLEIYISKIMVLLNNKKRLEINFQAFTF